MTYNFLDHTADVKFLAEGKTIEEVLIESAKALKEAICGNITVLQQTTKNISIQGISLENMLYKFLEEFLVILDSEELLLSEIKNIKINQETFLVECEATFDKTEHYKFTNDVKAVTYSEMFIRKNQEKDVWQTQVVLDV